MGSQQSNNASEEFKAGPDLVIITGMSGAGRTEAMHTFEDLDYFCIDNLPPSLLLDLVSLAGLSAKGNRKLAAVCDIRAKEFFYRLNEELHRITEAGISYRILFLDSRDDVLLARFKESRRRHPLTDEGMTISEGIQRERELLKTMRQAADALIDTSDIDARELRRQIRHLYSRETDQESLKVSVFSFGFKHGMPVGADNIIDVRFLPNPYYELELRALSGLDNGVRDFVLDREETKRFLESWHNLLSIIMPGYVQEGKQFLSIGIGCTGGQHRSVVIAEETALHLRQTGYSVSISHRDLALAELD